MSNPRVLQVALSLNPGGTERLVVELAKRLAADIPMMVCCLDEPGAWAPEVEERGITVTALRRGSGFRPALGRAVADAARRHNASVIHAHHYSPFVYSCLARVWRPSARVVFTEHGRLSDARPSSKRRAANRVLGRIPHRVFTVSEDLKQHMLGEGFRDEAVSVIYNGIDPTRVPDEHDREGARRLMAVKDETLVIGTIARLDPVKDLGSLIRAVAQISSEIPVVLLVIGDGPERPALERLVGELRAEQCVRFVGYRDDARRWLAGCDVFVNCSVSEGVSLTILEAMAAALPVLVTRVGGTPEVVDETCGRLVPARDPAALSAALLDLARQPALRRDLGQAARRRVETRFTLDRMVREYRDVYNEVA